MFEDILKTGVDLGKKYVENEIAEHGKKQPETRPDTEQVPGKIVVETKSMDKKTMYIVGGSVVAGLVVLGLILKK